MPNELHTAAADALHGFVEVKRLVEEEKVNVNELHSEYGTRAIDFAAQSGSLESLKWLIEVAGADLDSSNKEHNLLYWGLHNTPDILEYLTDPNRELYKKFNDGTTKFHVAAMTGRQQEVMDILSHHPDAIKEKNKKNQTALYWAANAGRYSIVEGIMNDKIFTSLFPQERLMLLRDVSVGLNMLGERNFKENKIDSARATYEKAIFYNQMIDDKDDVDYWILADCYKHIAVIHLKQENDAKVIDAFKEAIAIYEKMNKKDDEDYRSLVMCCNQLAKTYYCQNKEIETIAMLKKAASFCKLMNDQCVSKKYLQERVDDNLNIVLQHSLPALAKIWGFECRDAKRDGNCFFHAVVDQFIIQNISKYRAYTYVDLRAIVQRHISRYLDFYKDFIDSDPKEYINEVGKNGSWVDHHMIIALSREFNVTIVIIRNDGEDPQIIKRQQPEATLFLGFERDRHYQSLKARLDWTPTQFIEPYIDRTSADDYLVDHDKMDQNTKKRINDDMETDHVENKCIKIECSTVNNGHPSFFASSSGERENSNDEQKINNHFKI